MAKTGSVTAPDAQPIPDHHAAHTILSEIEDALKDGTVLTTEFVAWCRAKFAEAKSHL